MAPALRTCLLADRSGIDGNLLPVFAQSFETNYAVHFGKQGVIPAAAHVLTGVDLGAALTVKDVARQNELAIRPLCAETL